MEATSHSHESHSHPHEHDHGPEDWNNQEQVARWLEHEAGEAAEHHEQYVTIRALLPKLRQSEFTYLNLGAGNGGLDKVLLEAFPNAEATLVDGSLLMLGMARKELEGFGDRVEYVQANLNGPEWLGAVSGPYDFIVSTIALHHVGDARRIRELYGECFRLLGHGGMFLNLDFVRAHRAFEGYGMWASRDAEAALNHDGGEAHLAGTLVEHLGWLSEAGFTASDVVWKDMNVALFVGLKDHLHLPAESHAEADEHSHSHSHGDEAHSHSHEHEEHSHGDHDHDHADHDHDSHSHDEHDHDHGEHHHH